MPLINRPERSSHWYYPDGRACHEVIATSSGLPRPTTLRDARKLGLIPSVTNILNMKAKPALNTWLQDNAILAALNTERRPGELEEDWHSRIAEESDRIGKEAAELGQLIHEQVEQFNLHRAFLGTGEIVEYVRGYETWFHENVVEVIGAEDSVVGPGYAGRRDLCAIVKHEGRNRRAVIDVKSQKLKGKPKANFYIEWSMQLAAYAEPNREPEDEAPLLISLAIPSDRKDAVQPKVWENYDQALRAFRACQTLWCFDKDYYPEGLTWAR
jgi:hypothetical protein